MKQEFIGELACISDQGKLELTENRSSEGDEILAGTLTCTRCGRKYQILRGIPHLMDIESERESKKLARFGEQWTWFLKGKFENPQESQYGWDRETIIRDFFEITGLDPATIRGKRILDAGSGASKIAYFLTRTFPEIDFEIVSLEVSEAVYAGAQRASERRAPHLRADLFHPGLARESFDVVYSVGVLHHTPEPRKAFEALVPLVKPGGIFATWMYSKRFNPYLDITGWVWPAVRHLPSSLIYVVAFLMTPFFWIFSRVAYLIKLVFNPKSGRWRTIKLLPFGGILLRVFDFLQTYYRFRYWPEEIIPWYEDNGFTDMVIIRPGTNAIRATKK